MRLQCIIVALSRMETVARTMYLISMSFLQAIMMHVRNLSIERGNAHNGTLCQYKCLIGCSSSLYLPPVIGLPHFGCCRQEFTHQLTLVQNAIVQKAGNFLFPCATKMLQWKQWPTSTAAMVTPTSLISLETSYLYSSHHQEQHYKNEFILTIIRCYYKHIAVSNLNQFIQFLRNYHVL